MFRYWATCLSISPGPPVRCRTWRSRTSRDRRRSSTRICSRRLPATRRRSRRGGGTERREEEGEWQVGVGVTKGEGV